MERLARFPVDRIQGNREQGILREVAEAIEDCEDPEKLRNFGRSLRMLSDLARTKGFMNGGKFY